MAAVVVNRRRRSWPAAALLLIILFATSSQSTAIVKDFDTDQKILWSSDYGNIQQQHHDKVDTTTTTTTEFGPSEAMARERGPHIFNAVHNAMRQFGSSLHHNGMALIPGYIPEGVLLYHGSSTREVPSSFDWLAFEVEHAENFARPMPGRPRPPPPPGHDGDDHDHEAAAAGFGHHHPPPPPRGFGSHRPPPPPPPGHENGIDFRHRRPPPPPPSADHENGADLDYHHPPPPPPGGFGRHGPPPPPPHNRPPPPPHHREEARGQDGHTGDDDRHHPHHVNDDSDDWLKGYLHIYQTTRPLNILYIDGMAAGKTPNGTLDTQDLVLTGPVRRPGEDEHVHRPERKYFDEHARARDMCALSSVWGVDGFVRMEPGFELILCDFGGGVRLVDMMGRIGKRDDDGPPHPRYSRHYQSQPMTGGSEREEEEEKDDDNDKKHGKQYQYRDIQSFQWVRAASQRYNDIGSRRVILDFSAMTSAMWYSPLDIFPSSQSDHLPRLTQASDAELAILKRDVGISVRRSIVERKTGGRFGFQKDWQGVADMVVSRYSGALGLLGGLDMDDADEAAAGLRLMRGEVKNMLDLFIDYRVDEGKEEGDWEYMARRRCIRHYLLPVQSGVNTPEDKLLRAAFEETMERICGTLFEVRRVVFPELYTGTSLTASSPSLNSSPRPEKTESDDSTALFIAQTMIRRLIHILGWSTWKECGECPGADQVCFIAMWPFGDEDDHWNPKCLSIDDKIGNRHTYWARMGGGPGWPGGKGKGDKGKKEEGDMKNKKETTDWHKQEGAMEELSQEL